MTTWNLTLTHATYEMNRNAAKAPPRMNEWKKRQKSTQTHTHTDSEKKMNISFLQHPENVYFECIKKS